MSHNEETKNSKPGEDVKIKFLLKSLRIPTKLKSKNIEILFKDKVMKTLPIL